MVYNDLNNADIDRLEIGLTSTCNLKCPLCIRQINPDYTKTDTIFRDIEDIIEQIDSYPNLKFISIAGAISEPTLHPDLFKLIIYLKRRKIDISLFINGGTHDDLYYKKLGSVFNGAIGSIYFTICGSTQELHEKYRVNSNLDTVIRRLEIVQKYSSSAKLTWILFEYNKEDYEKNYHKFTKYDLESFNTLPMVEHFNLTDVPEGIHLVNELHNIYKSEIIKTDFENISCPAINYKFQLVDFTGKTSPCILFNLYGDAHCYECSSLNAKTLRSNKIYKVAEPEDEYSGEQLRFESDR